MENKKGPYDFSFGDLEAFSGRLIKKAFRSFRQILIIILYIVAIFFVMNDFSLNIESTAELAETKLPWLVLYILAHYFCRDYGIMRGREDDEFVKVNELYLESCDKLRYKRQEFEEYCTRLCEHYTEQRRLRILEAFEANGTIGEVKLAIEGKDEITHFANSEKRKYRAVRRALKRLKRLERRRPIVITYSSVCSRAEQQNGKAVDEAPLKAPFEKYIRRRSWVSVIKIAFFAFFTFSLTASLGSDPLGNFVAGIPYLATMVSVSITAALGAYRSVLMYDIDRLNDKISVISGFFEQEKVPRDF